MTTYLFFRFCKALGGFDDPKPGAALLLVCIAADGFLVVTAVKWVLS